MAESIYYEYWERRGEVMKLTFLTHGGSRETLVAAESNWRGKYDLDSPVITDIKDAHFKEKMESRDWGWIYHKKEVPSGE